MVDKTLLPIMRLRRPSSSGVISTFASTGILCKFFVDTITVDVVLVKVVGLRHGLLPLRDVDLVI